MGNPVEFRVLGPLEVIAAGESIRLREAVLHRPHVLIMDLRMGEITTTIAEVRRAAPNTAVLVFTMADDDESVFAAMRAGARGYLLKRAERDDIVRAIRGVAAGGAVFGSPIAERLSTLFDQSPPACPTRPSPAAWTSPGRPSATTCRPSSPSSQSPAAPKQSSLPGRPASAANPEPCPTFA